MRFLHYCVFMLSLLFLFIAGCGGGGGGSSTISPTPTTKTATLKLSTQSSINTTALIGGFDLKVTLPVVASLQTDASGTPLTSAVFLSGQFAGPNFSPSTSYNSATHQVTVIYGSSNTYSLGEFITIVMTVPSNYFLNQSDIIVNTFIAGEPITGNPIPTVTATVLSFN